MGRICLSKVVLISYRSNSRHYQSLENRLFVLWKRSRLRSYGALAPQHRNEIDYDDQERHQWESVESIFCLPVLLVCLPPNPLPHGRICYCISNQYIQPLQTVCTDTGACRADHRTQSFFTLTPGTGETRIPRWHHAFALCPQKTIKRR